MSGSSLDGLDICLATFEVSDNQEVLSFSVLQTEAVDFSDAFIKRWRQVPEASAIELARLHADTGRYFGQLTRDFIHRHGLKNIDAVASHGYTVFHQPEAGFTTQIGCGAQLAAQTQCRVITDFRMADVAAGGQGAPLVPFAERHLFPQYRTFLNIGGIVNISFHPKENADAVIAYDVCAGNTLLNYLAREKGSEYDKDGAWARSGKILPELLRELNEIPFCAAVYPKSLGTEHVQEYWLQRIIASSGSVEDKLATAVEHIAMQVAAAVARQSQAADMLVTGGGALNKYLVERIQVHLSGKVIVPDNTIVQFKEALLMALLGLFRLREWANVLNSATGAAKSTCGGAIYLP